MDSLRDAVTSGVRPTLLAILGAVVLLLVIACVNVSNLLLARTLARRAELAVRTALGAGRARLMRQLITESLLLSLAGGLLGLGVAIAVSRALFSLAPDSLSRSGRPGLDVSVFALALALSAFVGLAVGVLPALRGVAEDLYVAVRSGSRTTDAGHQSVRRGLVVTQVALAFVLLTSTGLLLRSVDRLLTTSPGFDASGVLTLQIVATGRNWNSFEELARFYERSLEAVRAVPGVVDA